MRCVLCEEKIAVKEKLVSNLVAHRECLLRNVIGGIGHLEDHAYWCLQMNDPDGGRTLRQSGLEVDAWIARYGVPQHLQP